MFLTLYYIVIIMVYARFKRTRKGSGAYGRKRTVTRRRRTAGFKKVARPRFALSGFRKNIEKKYLDKTYQSDMNETLSGNIDQTTKTNNGVTVISNTWGQYTFGQQTAPVGVSNDVLKGLGTGTTARTRIGNKVKVKYVKGAFTFNAAMVDTVVLRPQGGEAFAALATASKRWDYLRTTYRMVIVKDLQVNSTDTYIRWHHVFDTSNQAAGIHSELNVDNMGRFIVLEDKMFTLDGQNPQKTVPFLINGSSIGSVRYNGPTEEALTDKGVYVIWAAFVMGYFGSLNEVEVPPPVGHSRLCFTDE